MTNNIKRGIVLNNGKKIEIPEDSIAVGKGFGSLNILGEVVFAGQSTGTHTNGNTYTYDNVDFIAYRTDSNGQTEITSNGLKISRNSSSVSPNYHGIYSPGNSNTGGWIYKKIGMSRFHRGNWQYWIRFYNINIGSMISAFTGGDCNGQHPYHGVSARRVKTGISTPATQGANQATIYGPISEKSVNMLNTDTGYQYDTLCISALSPVLFQVKCGVYDSGYPDFRSMINVGILNFMSNSHHVGAHDTTNVTFLRDLKLWQTMLLLGGTGEGDVTIERIRLTSFE